MTDNAPDNAKASSSADPRPEDLTLGRAKAIETLDPEASTSGWEDKIFMNDDMRQELLLTVSEQIPVKTVYLASAKAPVDSFESMMFAIQLWQNNAPELLMSPLKGKAVVYPTEYLHAQPLTSKPVTLSTKEYMGRFDFKPLEWPSAESDKNEPILIVKNMARGRLVVAVQLAACLQTFAALSPHEDTLLVKSWYHRWAKNVEALMEITGSVYTHITRLGADNRRIKHELLALSEKSEMLTDHVVAFEDVKLDPAGSYQYHLAYMIAARNDLEELIPVIQGCIKAIDGDVDGSKVLKRAQ